MNKKLVAQRIIFTVLALLCMAAIFYFSSQNAHKSSVLSEFVARLFHLKSGGGKGASERIIFLGLSLRKIGHICEFFMLGLFVFQAVRAWGYKLKTISWAAFTFVICYLYAVSDEIHQCFVPRRGPSFFDTLIDAIGIIIAILISVAIFHRRREEK